MQLAVPNVVAIAVRMVITMLRILPQVVLLLNVPIVISLRFKVSSFKFQVSFPFFTFPCARFIREYLKLET